MKFLWWIVLAVVAVLLILFAVSNSAAVLVGLWPLPETIELPLYLLVVATLIIGFFFGELVAWIGGWRWRREARRSRERIAMLERELAAERTQHVAACAPLAVVAR